MAGVALDGISKAYGARIVLDKISLHLGIGERAALVGANGSGKSTLLKIIKSLEFPDQGSIAITNLEDMGYLPQTLSYSLDQTVGSLIDDCVLPLRNMQQKMSKLALSMSTSDPMRLEEIMDEYGQLATRFEQRGGYELDLRIESVIQALSLRHLERTHKLAQLSGGELTRLGLATLLISSPELLLLDEPTNHLDTQMFQWLESYLLKYRGTVLIASHDRHFLNCVVTKVFEIDEHDHQLRTYVGNYDAYRQQKLIERRRWEEQYELQQEELNVLRTRLHDKARQIGHHRPPKDHDKSAYDARGQSVQRAVSRNLRSVQTRIDQLKKEMVRRPPEPLKFHANFIRERVNSPYSLSVSELSLRLNDGRRLLKKVRFTLGRDEHMLLTGPNGAGKSTLLDIIVQRRQADEGQVFIPSPIKIGYLRQDASPQGIQLSVLDYFRQELVGALDGHVTQLLSFGLYTSFDDCLMRVDQLSPGQL